MRPSRYRWNCADTVVMTEMLAMATIVAHARVDHVTMLISTHPMKLHVAWRGVPFSVRPGSCRALVGVNGSNLG